MKRHSKKVVLLVMVMAIGFIFTEFSVLAADYEYCSVLDKNAEWYAKSIGKMYCNDQRDGLYTVLFSGGECATNLCYQSFIIVCNNGEQEEVDGIDAGVKDCDTIPVVPPQPSSGDNSGANKGSGGFDGGGGGNKCVIGPWDDFCPIECQYCIWVPWK